MATERQIAANRRNGALGRGPKTAAGKARSSQNARQHGLAAEPSYESFQEVETVAHQLLGAVARERLPEAHLFAAAQLQILRARQMRTVVWKRFLGGADPAASPDGCADALALAVARVAKLYRYEAQASARRKRAFLDLCGGKTNILRMVAAEAERSVAEPQYLGWMVPPQAVSAESSRAALTRKWKRRVIDAGVPPVIYVKTQ